MFLCNIRTTQVLDVDFFPWCIRKILHLQGNRWRRSVLQNVRITANQSRSHQNETKKKKNHLTKVRALNMRLQKHCKRELYPTQKLACFALYLKTINTFLKNNIYTSYSKLSKELKNSFKIKVHLAFLELLIKTIFWLNHNLKTAWLTKISMPFFSSIDNLL